MKTFIIIVVFMTVSVTAGTIVMGTNTFEGVTVKNAYEKGLQWDSTRNALLKTGWKVHVTNKDISTGLNDISMEITDRADRPVRGAAVTLTVSRPSTAEYDRTYNTTEQQDGVYHARVDLPLYGHWDVKSDIALSGKSAILEEKIYAEKHK